MIDFEMDIDDRLSVEIHVNYYNPGYEAPYCRNPSCAAYYDPGDSGDCEYEIFAIHENKEGIKRYRKLPEKLIEAHSEEIEKEIEKRCNDYIAECQVESQLSALEY
jgi:hypothetical protein